MKLTIFTVNDIFIGGKLPFVDYRLMSLIDPNPNPGSEISHDLTVKIVTCVHFSLSKIDSENRTPPNSLVIEHKFGINFWI